MADTDPKINRRGLFNWLWKLFGILAIAQIGWVGLSFMNSRRKRTRQNSSAEIITAGPLERFIPGTVTAIPTGQFYLACLEDSSLLALSRSCTHLGCPVPWDEEKNQFACPCHGSTFNLRGEVLTLPAPRPLDTFPVRIENGIVKVDISVQRKRDRFDPNQTARI